MIRQHVIPWEKNVLDLWRGFDRYLTHLTFDQTSRAEHLKLWFFVFSSVASMNSTHATTLLPKFINQVRKLKKTELINEMFTALDLPSISNEVTETNILTNIILMLYHLMGIKEKSWEKSMKNLNSPFYWKKDNEENMIAYYQSFVVLASKLFMTEESQWKNLIVNITTARSEWTGVSFLSIEKTQQQELVKDAIFAFKGKFGLQMKPRIQWTILFNMMKEWKLPVPINKFEHINLWNHGASIGVHDRQSIDSYFTTLKFLTKYGRELIDGKVSWQTFQGNILLSIETYKMHINVMPIYLCHLKLSKLQQDIESSTNETLLGIVEVYDKEMIDFINGVVRGPYLRYFPDLISTYFRDPLLSTTDILSSV